MKASGLIVKIGRHKKITNLVIITENNKRLNMEIHGPLPEPIALMDYIYADYRMYANDQTGIGNRCVISDYRIDKTNEK